MEPLIILVALVVLGTPIGVIIALVRQSNLSRRIENLEADLRVTKEDLRNARESIAERPSAVLPVPRVATLLQRDRPAVVEPSPAEPKAVSAEISLPLENPPLPLLPATPPPIA